MRKARLAVVPLCAALVAPTPVAAPALAQQPPAAGQQIPTFTAGTSAVTLDVVVRDKKDKAVRDLQAADFEVYEDGVLQRVESFEVFGRPLEEPVSQPTSVAKAPAAAPEAAAVPTPAASVPKVETRPQVIAFVFDRLGPEARNTAQKAAMTYVDKGRVEGDLVGVFGIDLALRTLQPFTSDAELIRSGLERAGSQGNTAFSNSRAQTRDLVDTAIAGATAAEGTTGANPGQGGSAGDIASAAASGAIANAVSSMQAGMLRNFEALERDQQGYASTNGLLAVVNGLKSLPGRKTVVFFSEGLAIPANVVAQFRSVIHNANRANVSVYTMDAAGLRAESVNEETRKEMQQAQEQRRRVLESGRDDAGGAMTKSLERNEDLLRLNPESGLGQLAAETGGFSIRDTNDAASAFRRIEEDMRFHYLIGYTPSNENWDGRFRSITVKVKRSGIRVQSRQGYLAVRAIERAPLRSYEAPALARLDGKSRPHDFELQLAALSFPAADRPGLVPVLVRAPGAAPTYVRDKEDKNGEKLHRADFAVVVRIRNQAGEEVDRVSQHYPLAVSEKSLSAAKNGDILFYREADLGPGRYTLEAVAYDAASQKASVNTAILEVPHVEQGRARLSSLVLVGRVEKVNASEQSPGNPLYYGDTILYPSMGEPFHKSKSPAMGFFFAVYGIPGSTPPTKAVVEVLRGDTPAGRVTTDLPAPDANGRIQYAGALPLGSFAPGSYRLRVTAPGLEARETSFTVAE
jgi:VWFA-related protein